MQGVILKGSTKMDERYTYTYVAKNGNGTLFFMATEESCEDVLSNLVVYPKEWRYDNKELLSKEDYE